jgi:hypothetical protein
MGPASGFGAEEKKLKISEPPMESVIEERKLSNTPVDFIR